MPCSCLRRQTYTISRRLPGRWLHAQRLPRSVEKSHPAAKSKESFRESIASATDNKRRKGQLTADSLGEALKENSPEQKRGRKEARNKIIVAKVS